MFYSWPITVEAEHTVTNKKMIRMPMSVGVVHQVDILFPDTCDHNIRVQVFDANFQLWPSNRDGSVRGDAAVISFRDFYDMKASKNILTGYAWWEDVETEETIWIQLGVLPRAVLQPFSLAELLRAVQRS